MKIMILSSILLLSLIFLSSCSEEKIESKNMEQIYEEEGVPVRVASITKKSFDKELAYNTYLSGIKESSASSMIGGRIEKVLVKVGDFVKKDQIIITFPTDSPSAQYLQAKAAYNNAKTTFERYSKLFEVGGISAQNYDNMKTQYEVSKANWETVKKMVKILSPISGYVTKIAVKESDNVKKETMLITIADLRKLKASIKVPEDEISEITVGTKAYAIWQGKKIEGKVVQVDMAMNPRTQAFNADVVFANPNGIIKAGVTVDITIVQSSNSSVIAVERNNLVKYDNDLYAFVLNNDTAKKIKVKVGKSNGLFTEIIAGLSEGDILITEGQMFLEDNTKVKIIN